jgi:hypothetical protein
VACATCGLRCAAHWPHSCIEVPGFRNFNPSPLTIGFSDRIHALALRWLYADVTDPGVATGFSCRGAASAR